MYSIKSTVQCALSLSSFRLCIITLCLLEQVDVIHKCTTMFPDTIYGENVPNWVENVCELPELCLILNAHEPGLEMELFMFACWDFYKQSIYLLTF
jgi:hypothetical protein